jgi:hypothetical protein
MAVSAVTMWAGSTLNGTDILVPVTHVFTPPGIVPAVQLNLSLDASASLVQESTVYVCGELTNAMGLTSQQACVTGGSKVDRTPPPPFSVRDVNPGSSTPDINYNTVLQLAAAWDPASDDVSGISYYYVQLTSTSGKQLPYGGLGPAGPGPVVVTQPVLLQKTAVSYTFPVTPSVGLTYYASVQAVNGAPLLDANLMFGALHDYICFAGAGLTTTVTSRGIVIDQTPPVAVTVYDGTVSGVERSPAYVNSSTWWAASWPGFADPESGVVSRFYLSSVCFKLL